MAESTRNVPISDAGRSEPKRPQRLEDAAGVFRTLIAQHEQLAALLERAKEETDPGRRGEIWTEARRQLLSHERAEELEIYAALEGHAPARAMLEEHTDEARQLESLIGELDIIDYSSEDWMTRLMEVAALFEEHARGEEETFFPAAQRILGEPVARELEGRFASAQREIIDTLA